MPCFARSTAIWQRASPPPHRLEVHARIADDPATMTRIVQISDTHLSPGKSHFASNWAPVAAFVREQRPDIVVHTGDVTVDGADVEADFAHCASLFAELDAPVHAVPGNHDVGEPAHAHQPIDMHRIARWRRHLGHDWWSVDVDGWRLIGLDALLVGSGLPDEDAQLAWLDATMRDAGERMLAWFMHKPLFLVSPDEGDTGYWTIKPGPREALLARIRQHRVAMVATGHLHKMHRTVLDGCSYVWGPSSGFVVGERLQEEMPGDKRLGAVVHDFVPGTVTTRMVELPALSRYWIDDVIHEVYPPRNTA
jgi:3',5'-cyclic AMP phosphodiesterase CpdA